MSVEFGLSPDTRWSFSPVEIGAAAAKAGFTAVGFGPQHDVAGAAPALADLGVRCHELFVLIVSNDTRRTIAEAERMAAAAASVGAQWVPVIAFNNFTLDEQTAPMLAECARVLEAAGTRFGFEFGTIGSVRSIDEALAMVEATGSPDAGIVIDAWHFFQGPSSWEQLEQVPLERIAYVQFTDGVEPVSDDVMDETWNRRVWPGEGSFDLPRFVATLRDRGWDGLVSVEVLNAQYSQLPITEFAARAYEMTARYWA